MTTSLRSPFFTLLVALLIALQSGAADAPKRRAWMDAPAEQMARWEREKAALTILDISQETQRHAITAPHAARPQHARGAVAPRL
jgi:hypothetical protein